MRKDGFSLIELLIALAIVAILSVFIYPQYTQYLVKAKRLEAKGTLSRLSVALERYYLMHGSYKGATMSALNFPELIGDSYRLTLTASDDGYHIEAHPLGFQKEHDADCGTLQLDELGKKLSPEC